MSNETEPNTEAAKVAYESAKAALSAAQAEFDAAKVAYETLAGPAWFQECLDANSGLPRRKETLYKARELGADEKTCRKIANATRVSTGETIPIETRYGSKSRGKCWGRNADGEWAEKDEGTVFLTPGKWTVGSDDGFNRKENAVKWTVKTLKVGDQTWLIAD